MFVLQSEYVVFFRGGPNYDGDVPI